MFFFLLCAKYILPCRTKPRARRCVRRHVVLRVLRVHNDLFLQHAFQSVSLPFVVVQRFNGTNGLPSHSCGIFHFFRLLRSAFLGLAQQSGNFFSAITSAHSVYRYPRFLHPPQRNIFVARRAIIDRESTENRPRIDRESTENRPRIGISVFFTPLIFPRRQHCCV